MPIIASEHLDAIKRAAKPLAPDRREAFTADVIAALELVPEIGDSAVHRAIAAVQGRHCDPPQFADTLSRPRAGRVHIR